MKKEELENLRPTIKIALEKASSYCAYQERCQKEVRNKLYELKLDTDDVEEVLYLLIKEDFLNEERFSKSYARGKFRIKNWGKQRIVRELKFRDISAYNIKTALKEIDETEYLKTLYSITENRNEVISEPNVYKRKKKLIDFLMRKGFENDLIFKTVNEILS